MAGVKGRSGGPRKNSGGKRPGAGRKPKHPKPLRQPLPELSPEQEGALGAAPPSAPGASPPADAGAPPPAMALESGDAKEFLEGVLRGRILATPDQIRAAQALLPFQHKKLGESGKKEQRADEAGKVAGRFAPSPPRLAAANGKKV